MALMVHDSTQTRQKHALYTLKVEVKHYSFFQVGGHLTPVLLPCFRRLCAWVSYGYGYTRRSGRVEIFSAGWVRVRVSKSATGTGRVARMVDPHTSTAHHRWQCQIITWRDRAGMKRYRHRTGCRETEKHLKSH